MLTHHDHGLRALLARFTAWEHRLVIRFNRPNRRRLLSAFFGAVSRLGDGLFWYLLMAGLLILGLHYLSDVLVGALIGGTLALGKVCTTVASGRSARRTERSDRDITMS